MKIAIDVRSLMEGRHSGVEEYTTQIINAFVTVAPEHEYHLFYNSARPVALPPLSFTSKHYFRYPNKPFNLSQYLTGRPCWDSLLFSKIGRIDLFFVPNPRLLPLCGNTPIVMTAHDLSYARFPEFYSIKRRLWHHMIKPRRLMQSARHIIAVSNSTKEDIITIYGLPPDNISVIHSGVTRPSDPPDKGGEGGFYSTPQKYILYFGVLEPRKNVISIIEAYSAIAHRLSQDLVIAGERGWLDRQVTKAIQESTAQNRIHCLGSVAETDKWQLYANADLFVYPSFYEGFGFPPLEALISGTPVITSRNSSLPEIVGEWATMINPYDVAELALVMEELLKKPARVSLMTRELIKAQYSWEHTARQTLDIFTKVT